MPVSDLTRRLDVLGGCSTRSVQSIEAAWGDPAWTPPVAWGEAYLEAKARARLDAADQHSGRTVAFLEGLLVGAQLERPR